MDILEDYFQEFVEERAVKTIASIETRKEWKDLNEEFGELLDYLEETLNEEGKKKLNRIIHDLYRRMDIEGAAKYKCGLQDGIFLKQEYESEKVSTEGMTVQN